ncbi:hypothetical protein MIR68_002259 [Amoeboaphelidium protococcarum]|nr:hypothetical protein MIR68_002259 [Amoeboaphelidium protococcarum]
MKHIPRAVSVHRNRQQLQQSHSSQQQPHAERQKQNLSNSVVSSTSAYSRKRKQNDDNDIVQQKQKQKPGDPQTKLKANAIPNKKPQDQGTAMYVDNQNDDDDELVSMERLLGFGSFNSTKGQKVQDDKMVSGANIVKERKVRRVVKQKKK